MLMESVELQSIVSECFNEIDPVELNYLIQTGKSESYFRDKLAIYLHKKYPGATTYREYKRCDITVQSSDYQMQIELKQVYGAGLLCESKASLNQVKKLLDQTPDVNGTGLLFISEVSNSINDKYTAFIEKAFSLYHDISYRNRRYEELTKKTGWINSIIFDRVLPEGNRLVIIQFTKN